MTRLRRLILIVLLAILAVSFFAKKDLRGVGVILPALLQEPVQKAPSRVRPYRFTLKGFDYDVRPVADYEISALVASKIYLKSGVSGYDYEQAAPTDLVLVWGDNVKNDAFKKVKFYNDMGWGWYNAPRGVDFNPNQFSNNHLLIGDRKDIDKKAKSLGIGDQILLRGKLVNVSMRPASTSPEPDERSWNSSTTRTDTGAGACEVIYVEEIEVLKPAHILWRRLFTFSFWGLVFLIPLHIFSYFRRPLSDL